MRARFWQVVSYVSEAFWLLPALLVGGGVLLGEAMVQIDRSGVVPTWMIDNRWLYNGDGTGARTMLGSIASSTIGVAGTVFSITIAALSLAAGQMGPRLLRSFTHDRGNQVTLGIFLGTFTYTLMVLRSVRGKDAGAFVPNLSLTLDIIMAFVSVGMLVYFVGHMAGRINVHTVIDLVSADLEEIIERLTVEEAPPDRPPAEFWRDAVLVVDKRAGYLQQLDETRLADWAAAHGTAIQLLVRPGDYVFPGAPIAFMTKPVEDAAEAIRNAAALGGQRGTRTDIEFGIRQLVEVGVRALSPGINDPQTAISVLDRLGETLCKLAPRHLPTGVSLRQRHPALVRPAATYDGLVDAMFHMIRQYAAGSTAVFMRMIEVLTSVARCERRPDRLETLKRHVDLAHCDFSRSIENPSDLLELEGRRAIFMEVFRDGPGGGFERGS